jgi:hypothetical protein
MVHRFVFKSQIILLVTGEEKKMLMLWVRVQDITTG